jgi:hypothetical protein
MQMACMLGESCGKAILSLRHVNAHVASLLDGHLKSGHSLPPQVPRLTGQGLANGGPNMIAGVSAFAFQVGGGGVTRNARQEFL